MQKRYCACGRRLFVFFDHIRAWRVRFYSGRPALKGRFQTSTCPCCGSHLHIDQMR